MRGGLEARRQNNIVKSAFVGGRYFQEAKIGKTVGLIIGVVAAIAIAVAAPYLAGAFLAAIGTTTATALALTVTTALIGLTLAVGLSLAMRALGVGSVPSAKNQPGPPQVFRQSISNSFIVYGKRRVGGLMVFFHAAQSGSDHFRYFVIACAGHRCKGVVSWMLNDEIVTVDGSNMVTSGKYAGGAWLWFQRGLASETANATFVAETGGQWTSAHKGNGVAAMYAKFKMTDAVVQNGLPNITSIIEGRDEILDPRDASVDYTRNAALIFYDFMSIPREEGGFGAYADEVPEDAWINAQANVCDETVSSEARYSLDAVITTGASPAEVRDALIVNMAGSYAYSSGKHKVRPGYWVPVSVNLSEDDLAGPIQVSPFLTSDTAANEVQGTYVEPSDNYLPAPLTTQSVAAADIRQLDLDLAFVTSIGQANRVAAIMLKRAQAEKTVMWPMNIMGLGIQAMDTVQCDSARYGLSNYAFSVGNWSLSADWGTVLQLREENEEIYGEPGAASPASPPAIVQPTEPLITPSPTVVGPAQANVLYDNSGVTFQSADDLAYIVQGGSGTITSGVTMTYTVLSGTFNGFTSASGAQTITVTSGVGSVTPTSLTTSAAALQINAVLNGVSLPAFVTNVTKQLAAATPTGTGGGGGGATDVASQSSGFTAINTGTFTTITGSLTFTLPTGKTTLRCVVNLSCKYPRFANEQGPWDIEFKVRQGGVDQGSTQHSDPDPEIAPSDYGPISSSGTMQYTLDMTGLTSGVQYTVDVQARTASGTLPTGYNLSFTGTVTLSAP